MSMDAAVKEVLRRLMDDVQPPKLKDALSEVAKEMNVNEATLFQKVTAVQDQQSSAMKEMRERYAKMNKHALSKGMSRLPYKD